jgi:hypothetical protein
MTRPFQPIAECLWSVPAFRPSLMSNDDYEFDSYWLCERTTLAVRVTQADCNGCSHWSSEKVLVRARGRARPDAD